MQSFEQYSYTALKGLLIIPSLIPPTAQISLLSNLLHRDLINPEHLTNVHFHHKLPYSPKSFFSHHPDSKLQLEPLDPKTHKPISLYSFLTKKLRWVTLGGQYDWSAKVYPSEKPPPFPPDVAKLLETLFPEMRAEAAIVNFYSPGDVLSMHRDVAEESERGLVSISLGCEALFLVGIDDGEPLAIRLRSGDAVFMSGPSRFAWHGVPRIIEGTCPEYLEHWPGGEFEHWRGWMKDKRVNLNVRQMWD
jgi:alkylated DNA repair protein alkB homolog 1